MSLWGIRLYFICNQDLWSLNINSIFIWSKFIMRSNYYIEKCLKWCSGLDGSQDLLNGRVKMAVLPARHIFEIWCISLCGLAWAYKPLESISFKNTFFRNLLRTLEIYYIPSAGKKEKLQVQKQPIFLAAENDAVY